MINRYSDVPTSGFGTGRPPATPEGRGVTQELFTYEEADEILRLHGRNDYVGISAIDRLIAAVAAGPAYIEQKVWLPHVFAGRIPEGTEGILTVRSQN
jgi:uncharacterized protein